MSETKVIIIGCGIAGPVLATFLKLKGYHPVVYDRIDGPGEAGISLILQPNGLRILAQIPGLLERLSDSVLDEFAVDSTVPGHEGVLARNDGPGRFIQEFGVSMKPVLRTELHRSLVESAEQYGVEIKWGHKLTHLEEVGEDSVRVIFANGASDVGSFVVGCDGLHSNTRTALFGEEEVEYTGLTQTSGISDTPLELQGSNASFQYFGNGSHFLTYRPCKTKHSWASTRREPESKESWREVNTITQQKVQAELLKTWNSGIPKQLIENTSIIVKYGCYDRPELKIWHKGRVVLLGDAAHPTSPHIGQGANQAFVDVHTLLSSLIKHNPDAIPLSTATLETVFTEYENLRISKTSEAVKAARIGGELRVVSGIEECIKRNEIVKATWGDPTKLIKAYQDLYGEAPVNLISS